MRQVFLLGLNDLRLTLRDRPAFVWMLAFPVMMMWFFGGIGGQQSTTPQISLGVMNQDRGWLSEAFIEDLADETLALQRYDGSEPAEERVRTLVIPEGFTRDVLSGQPRSIRMLTASTISSLRPS